MKEYTISELLKEFKVLNLSELARMADINISLMHEYKRGSTTYISKERREDIEELVHQLGRSLLEVRIK